MNDSSRCRFSEDAANDLQSIWDFIAREAGSETAATYLEILLRTAERLTRFPQLGRSRNELREGWRSLAEGAHILFYREMDDGIELMRVIHGSRDLDPLLREDDNG